MLPTHNKKDQDEEKKKYLTKSQKYSKFEGKSI